MIDSIKKNDNVAEYLLYMWQIEDLIRANRLDMDLIRKSIIDKFQGLSPEKRREMEEWYESLIDMMRREGKEASPQTQQAAAQISKFLGTLAAYYKKDHADELDLS